MFKNINLRLSYKLLIPIITAFAFYHCASNDKYKTPIDEHLPSSNVEQTQFYLDEVQPLLNRRCVVCHTCLEAPCQLHLDSYDGIRRGATYAELGSGILYSEPTRDKDAKTMSEWRAKNFFPVIPDPDIDALSMNATIPSLRDSEISLLYRFAELGHLNNKPGFALAPIIEHRDRARTCAPNISAFAEYSKLYPYAGMPYGLPGLDKQQLLTLKKWIDQGAPVPTAFQQQLQSASSVSDQIAEWESLLNQTSKAKLMARYIYEHVFNAHIHFKGSPPDEWYELIRSSVQAPELPQEIVTPRPYDDPKTSNVFYRFKRLTRPIARASHIPWEINHKTLNHLEDLFLKTRWSNDQAHSPVQSESIEDPGYSTINPFKYFKAIPARLRYQFLLENSQMIANAMIRGPACSGRVATNAIRDHFWVFFLRPESDVTVFNPEIGLAEWTPLSELDLKDFVEPSLKYTNAMQKFKPNGFSLNDLWTSENYNPNALLTIFRHGTNASVHQGLVGGKPLTYWVLNYSNFERIYYNLVADFEPWGSSAHKASTWNYMSRHRAEAEERFISFLPETHRKPVRFQWTQGLGSAMNLTQSQLSKGIKTQVVLDDDKNPVESLLHLFLSQYSPEQLNPDNQTPNWVLSKPLPFNAIKTVEDWETAIIQLANRGEIAAARYWPDVVYFRIQDSIYTIVNHRSYKFNNLLALEKLAYEPHKNRLFVLRGVIGARPEYFGDLRAPQLGTFVRDLSKVSLYSDWVNFKNKYFVRRNNPKVWIASDWITDWLARNQPLDSGLNDLRDYDTQADQ